MYSICLEMLCENMLVVYLSKMCAGVGFLPIVIVLECGMARGKAIICDCKGNVGL